MCFGPRSLLAVTRRQTFMGRPRPFLLCRLCRLHRRAAVRSGDCSGTRNKKPGETQQSGDTKRSFQQRSGQARPSEDVLDAFGRQLGSWVASGLRAAWAGAKQGTWAAVKPALAAAGALGGTAWVGHHLWQKAGAQQQEVPDDPTVHWPNALPAIKQLAEANRSSTVGSAAIHKDARTSIEERLKDDTFMSTILVSGPRNAGKSWTTRFAIDNCAKDNADNDIHVIWVKANNISSVKQLTTAIEKAAGLRWRKADGQTALLELTLPESAKALLTTPPDDPEERLDKVLEVIGTQWGAKKGKRKCILLLDDFMASDPSLPPSSAVPRAFRAVIKKLTFFAQNGILHPIVVSSDPNISMYFSHQHLRSIDVGWLTESEVRGYVRCFFENQVEHTGSEPSVINAYDPEKVATEIIAKVGRLVYHVREACARFKDEDPSQRSEADVIDDIVERLVSYEYRCLDQAILASGKEKAVRAALKEWQKWGKKDEQAQLSRKQYTKLACPAKAGIEVLIAAGVLYKDTVGTIKETSIPARTAMQEFFDSPQS